MLGKQRTLLRVPVRMANRRLLYYGIYSVNVAASARPSSKMAPEQILSFVPEHDIKLLVLGTIARTGVSGMLMGNTAENVQRFPPCSILDNKKSNYL
jgi:hypothetical protein